MELNIGDLLRYKKKYELIREKYKLLKDNDSSESNYYIVFLKDVVAKHVRSGQFRTSKGVFLRVRQISNSKNGPWIVEMTRKDANYRMKTGYNVGKTSIFSEYNSSDEDDSSEDNSSDQEYY